MNEQTRNLTCMQRQAIEVARREIELKSSGRVDRDWLIARTSARTGVAASIIRAGLAEPERA